MIFSASIVALVAAPTVFGQLLFGPARSSIIDETTRARYLFPPSRGWSSLVSNIGPCQGFERAGRIHYPIRGGNISWETVVDVGDITFSYSTETDPTRQDQFRVALSDVEGGWSGSQCIPGPDFGALGVEVGQNVTLQLSYTAGYAALTGYECADLIIVSEADFAARNYDTQCRNRVDTTKERNDAASNPQLVPLRAEAERNHLRLQQLRELETSPETKGPLTPTEAGLVGAFVTLGAMLLLQAVGFFTGVVSFGRKKRATGASGSESGNGGARAPGQGLEEVKSLSSA